MSVSNLLQLWTGQPVKFMAILLAAAGLASHAQVRIETDRNGLPLITNRGSVEASSSKSDDDDYTPPKGIKNKRSDKGLVESKLKQACLKRDLDYSLVASLVQAESSFNHYTMSRKGAIGLMQLMPGTAKRFGCKDPWNLDQNIEGGTAYLEYLNGYFSGDIPLVLAAYNAGENAVMKYSKKIPPYSETVRYVFTILNTYGKPHLITEAKESLASPEDYNRYYIPRRNYKVPTRTYWMYFKDGVRNFTDTRISGVELIPIVYKDE